MMKKILIGAGLVGVGFVAGYVVCKMVEDSFHKNIFDEDDDFDDFDDFDEDLDADDSVESVSDMLDNFANTMRSDDKANETTEEDGDK